MTNYHSKYWAYALNLQSASDTIRNLSRSIANAKVDLNPHQVHAALFALQSPLSNGVILADEVGLGKTIEAGLVIAQHWAERKRRILVITPAFIRKQWESELKDKFGLPCRIIDSKTGGFNTSPDDEILICSYPFAAQRADQIAKEWDLIVIDEAHRMRNVYKTSNIQARAISDALQGKRKLLLTATPLQNNLMELYGLVSVIDPYVFGDEVSFRDQFVQRRDLEERNHALRKRLEPFIVRTLRKQVQEYVPFTKRVAITQNFTPSDDEQSLYDSVSAYLQRKDLIALPNSQRQLITLVLRKLLASSTFAIMDTLQAMIDRLEKKAGPKSLLEELDFDQLETLDEELKEKLIAIQPDAEAIATRENTLNEAIELRTYLELAKKIRNNSKGQSLLIALERALSKAEELGAERKVVIFTESVRTQTYLHELLSNNGYESKIVRLNGSNNDEESKAIYKNWLALNPDPSSRVSKAVDMKAALVEYFQNDAVILLATEAAAEGINLQFASLVVNYDLPWNPQRIEQRIGRCHRYGQKHDVVVVNFVNTRNEADKRVFELLAEKFQLFDGVFGASDEVLGAIESGVDIEMRIHEVYQTCRTPEEIQIAFDTLRKELDEQIQAKMEQTRESILDNFDEEVTTLLRTCQANTQAALGQREHWLFQLACYELTHPISTHPFFLHEGLHYCMDWRLAEEKNGKFFREDDPLAQKLIRTAVQRDLQPCHLIFDYSSYPQKISLLEPLIGCSGWLELSLLRIDTFEKVEALLFTAFTDDSKSVGPDVAEKIFQLKAKSSQPIILGNLPSFDISREELKQQQIKIIEERAGELYEREVEKLFAWSEDQKLSLEREIAELDKEIRAARKSAALAKTLIEKLEIQKKIRHLDSQRSNKRRSLFTEQDRIDEERDSLIERHAKRMVPNVSVEPLFIIRWSIE